MLGGVRKLGTAGIELVPMPQLGARRAVGLWWEFRQSLGLYFRLLGSLYGCLGP